ncbi:MBL fold metallo-hydrolase [Candidatus Bathyarchaeota archaeon]|jgi:glyoxylase-like metal-dependent hydrolase (beta-lactamase superfamily II)|nr:MBL fold metallo-hydrolase [Candidatus Bathyarchaeota archaeon]MBT4320063.1 MBL fold metallo-hydrolase [Candidatus Bathyarchaeota archaeon]MBT4423994.1 MBL fold metallo-hydrolase [Candidatus Bathyarchaeota archaeon]MBT5643088.1 MBL fold metallo-hydrolase [Candidatus Bathyarchaeota archaeon]MBT6605927.1 MBL fold metallo-hydrolase [Candidatus Bathyarchaeota archaeon]
MVKILEGVYGIDHSADKNHSLESWILDCEKTILIDGGMTGEHVKGIGRELESIGKGWKDVDLILVTHKHPDHINNLPELVELTGAPIKAQKFEAPLIEVAQGVKVEGLEDHEVLPYCGGIEVIHVPGHSEGNSCFYLRNQKLIIAGDTIRADVPGVITPPPERYCLDVEEATREIRRLLDYDFDHLIYSHGVDTMEGAKKKVRELVKKTS